MTCSPLLHYWKKLWCFLFIAIPCQALPQTAFEMGNGLKLSPLFLFLPFFHHLYSDNVRRAGLQTNSQSIQQAGIYSHPPDSHAILKALLIPDDLPDWHLQHLYQRWHQAHFPHHYPTTVSESATLPRRAGNMTSKEPEHRIYLSLVNQQFHIVIQPSYQLPMPMQAVLAERTLNTLQHFYQLVLDRYDLSDTVEQFISSVAAGGDGGDDDPYYSPGRGKFDVFVYQPDTGWQPLFRRLHRQGLLGQSIQKKRRLLNILQQRIRQTIHSGHEQLARILQDRIIVVEVDLDELLYQVNSLGTEFHSNEAPVAPLLQNLLRQTGTLEKEQACFDVYFPPPEDGGGESQSKKATTSQHSQHQGKQGKRPSKDDGEAPPEKKHRQQSDDGGEDRKNAASDALSNEQLLANIPYQLQLDIAWEFKDEISLFDQACAVVENEFDRQEIPYIRAFLFIKKCIAVHKIESVMQLVRRLSGAGKEFEERLIRVIREYREESIQMIEGEYSDFYSFLSLNTLPFLRLLSMSVVTGLHLGLSFRQMRKVERNSYKGKKLDIFDLYKEEHPRTLLAWFFPQIKKALSRIGKPEWYDEIYTAFTTSVSQQPPLTGQEYQSANGKTGIPQSRDTPFDKNSCLQPVIVCGKYLPAEIWVHVFSFMDLDTLSTCRLVCKTFHMIADNPTLPKTNPAIADCINKGLCLNNDIDMDKERVEKSFWFHSTDWFSALARRKTHPEIIRRCISHSCFLAGYLWKEQCLLKIKLLVTGKPDHDIWIKQIASDYNQHAPDPQDRFSVVIRSNTSIIYIILDQSGRTRTCILKQDNYRSLGDGNEGEVCMPYLIDTIVLDNQSLFVTYGQNALHIWNTSKPKTEYLQGVISHINCMTVMKRMTSHVIVIGFSYGKCRYLQSYEIQNSSLGCIAVKSENIPVSYRVKALRTMHNQTKLIVLSHRLHLGVWEFNSEGSLHNIVKPRQLMDGDENQKVLSFCLPSVSFGDTIYGIVNRNSIIGFNYNLEFIFIFEIAPLAFYSCIGIGVIDDNILILVFPSTVQLFHCDREGKRNPLMIHRLDSDSKVTAMTVLDNNHLLLGFQDGEVSLYFLPYLPSFSAFPR